MDYKLMCKTCGKIYQLSEKEYLNLKLKLMWNAKLNGLHDLEVTRFMNVFAKCCKKPDYMEMVEKR